MEFWFLPHGNPRIEQGAQIFREDRNYIKSVNLFPHFEQSRRMMGAAHTDILVFFAAIESRSVS